MISFDEHESMAWVEFAKHIRECTWGNPSSLAEREDEICIREEEFFEDAFQIKIVDNLVKVKWEAPCSWVGCTWHLYYCQMSKADWKSPYEMVTEVNA